MEATERGGFVLLKMEQISKSYGKKRALHNISLEIPIGVCYGLVGPNGAGKSTLLKIIASIIRDYSGHIEISGESRSIGYVPQEIALEETLTAYDNLKFFGKLYGLSGKTLNERIDEVLKEIGVESRAKDKVATFSGGMKRRLNIGCAILHRPQLIIMDEPTVGIDPQSRKYIFQMLESFKKAGRTIIYASHYMEEIEQLCDAAAFIDHGEIVEKGRLHDILRKHAVPSVFVKGGGITKENVSDFGEVSVKESGVLIMTEQPLDVMERILEICKKSGAALERLELVQPRLEDVFFSLTGKHLRD